MFAGMPLDNRGSPIRGRRRGVAALAVTQMSPTVWDDLLFHSDRQICNIEPKICQYG
jgi:hypothetical protein